MSKRKKSTPKLSAAQMAVPALRDLSQLEPRQCEKVQAALEDVFRLYWFGSMDATAYRVAMEPLFNVMQAPPPPLGVQVQETIVTEDVVR
ncbi:MAG: hypothetical protein ACYSVY_00020 [Planctomycetota bacterium]|jgi:hypothetical protein